MLIYILIKQVVIEAIIIQEIQTPYQKMEQGIVLKQLKLKFIK